MNKVLGFGAALLSFLAALLTYLQTIHPAPLGRQETRVLQKSVKYPQRGSCGHP